MASGRAPGIGAVLALILLATVIDGMDASIVNVILPEMAGDLGMSVSSSAFVSVAYLIPIAGLCLALSKVADRTDVRRMFLVGTVLFSLASVGCALSPDQVTMVAFRFVQGLGAAFMVASTPIMVVRLLPEDRRGVGMACIAAGSGISVVIGPTVGGIVGDLLSWHWVFLINIPLGIVLAAASVALLPRGRPVSESVMPDRRATVLMFAGVALTMVSMYGYVDGFLDPVIAVVACVVGAALVIASLARPSGRGEPLAQLSLLRGRRFATVSLVFLVSTMMGAGTMYLLPFYLSIVEGMDSLLIGVVLAAASVITVVVAVPTGRWCDSRGCRTPACISLALRVVFSVMLAVIDPSLGILFLMASLAVLGLSFGMSGTSQSTRMLEEAPEESSGEAGSMAMMINYVGYALGLAAFAVVFSLAAPGQGTDPSAMGADALLTGFHWACWFGAILAAIVLVVSLSVRPRTTAEQN